MAARFAPAGSRARSILIGIGFFIALMLYTQLYLVGDNSAGRGTPGAILFQGFMVGILNALTAAGLILIYRASRVINFAQGAIGVACAVFVANMVGYNPGFPFPITIIVGVAFAAMSGALLELVFARRFAKAPRLVLTIVTAAGSLFLLTISTGFVNRLGFFPKLADRVPQDLEPARLRTLMPFSGFHFRIGSSQIRFGFPEVFAIDMAIVSLIALAIFLRYTRAGTAVRAAAENAERAALLGIGVGGLSTLVWAISGALGGINVTVDSLLGDPSGLSRGNVALFIPIAAAILAGMSSLPIAIAASIGIGIATTATEYTYPGGAPAIAVALFLAICVALVLRRRQGFRESSEETSWQATEEPRPIPQELRGVSTLKWARLAVIAVGLLFAVLIPFMFATRIQVLFSATLLFGIVGLSLVVLTGWAGQVSFGQVGFLAIGAIVAGKLSASAHWSFWLAVPVAVVATAIVAGIIGLPALRIRGLYLAAVTFGFAVAIDELLTSPRYFQNDLPKQLHRPGLFFIDFEDERSMYFLCLVALVITVLVLYNLRRSRFGRVLIAARENEANVQSFGIGLVRIKLLAFVVSGAIAGFAGAIYAFQQRAVTGAAYGIDRSFAVFVSTILGGISSPAGALIGALWNNLSTYFFANNLVFGFIVGLIPLVVLYIEPGGMIAIINAVRDSWLRIVAQRRQIIVPSLFADYDPEALERRLIPLAEATAGEGMAALASGQSYTIESELYGETGRELEPAARRETREIATIAAISAEAGESQ